jgi:TorA maturation chaperone TorD
MINQHAIDQMRALSATRGDLYRVLSGLFLSAPSDQLLCEILSGEFLDGIQAAFGDHVADHFRQFKVKFDGDRTTLEQEFNDLFVVPAGRYVAPYECSFREKRLTEQGNLPGLLMGRTTEGVLAFYAEMGAAPDSAELPDHVALELGFMRLLVDRERTAWQSGRQTEAISLLAKEAQFLTQHVALWVPELCESVLANSRSEFYAGLAKLTQAFIATEMDLLTEAGASDEKATSAYR